MVGRAVKFITVSKVAFELGRSIQSRNAGDYVVLDCYHIHLDHWPYLEKGGE
jgi:hypothetical protein